MDLAYPLRFDGRGQTAETDDDAHVRDLIEQVLFTAPGERVNRPEFGSGVNALVFGPNSDVLAAATQFTMQGALQQWLGDRIQVNAVDVQNEDATLRVTVQYTILRTQDTRSAQFQREGGPP